MNFKEHDERNGKKDQTGSTVAQ